MSVSEAKAHFSEMLKHVKRGGKVTITRHGVPVVLLVPPAQRPAEQHDKVARNKK
jgi:prevent-host-death family protein